MSALADWGLARAAPRPVWWDQPGAPPVAPALAGAARADLVVVGGGPTGLWAAITAKDEDPGRNMVLLEANTVAYGASGRNGGFISDSLTHGLAHGVVTWPGEMPALLRLGRANLAETTDFLDKERIDARLRLCGKSVVATLPHHLAALERACRLHEAYGEDVSLLDQDEARGDVGSPTYLGALRVRSGGGLVDPVALCRGLARAADERGCAGTNTPRRRRWSRYRAASRCARRVARSPALRSCWRPTPSPRCCGGCGCGCCRCTTMCWPQAAVVRRARVAGLAAGAGGDRCRQPVPLLQPYR